MSSDKRPAADTGGSDEGPDPEGSPGRQLFTRSLAAAGDASVFASGSSRQFVAYTVKLPSEQLAALQSIWLELKRRYGAHSPDKSGMIQQAISEWLKKWDGPEQQELLNQLLEIRRDTRRRQYRKAP